jgi:hypothetical protein
MAIVQQNFGTVQALVKAGAYLFYPLWRCASPSMLSFIFIFNPTNFKNKRRDGIAAVQSSNMLQQEELRIQQCHLPFWLLFVKIRQNWKSQNICWNTGWTCLEKENG